LNLSIFINMYKSSVSTSDLTPGPSPKERGEGHELRRKPPLSFGEGLGVRSEGDIFYRAIHPYGM
jgi:hypothetical protein